MYPKVSMEWKYFLISSGEFFFFKFSSMNTQTLHYKYCICTQTYDIEM